MRKKIFAIAALGALAACSAAARPTTDVAPEPPTAASALSCEVRLASTRNGLRVEALAHTNEAIAGDYELVISKSGPNGASDITQGGPFDAPARAHVTLSASEFNMARGDRYRARLTLRDANGVACRDERRT